MAILLRLGITLLLLSMVACTKDVDEAEDKDLSRAEAAGAAVEVTPVSENLPVATATRAEPADSGSSAAASQAREIFSTRCVACHGEKGEGNGPASAGLNPKPRDLTSHEFQQSVTDEHIEKIIKFGGAGVGKSPMMPANPDLVAKPDVVTELRKIVRGLAGSE